MKVSPVEILLVEDNPGDILLTQKAFERTKLANRLVVARDGEEAMQRLRREGAFADVELPDLILLDINLPKMNGHEVLEQIKADPALRRIPVVMLTSSDRPDDIAASYDAHANSYVSKPADLQSLIEAVAGLESYWFALVKRCPPEDS